jgi:hypothetical protein
VGRRDPGDLARQAGSEVAALLPGWHNRLGAVAAGGAVGPVLFWHLGSDDKLVRPARRGWRKRRRRAQSIFIPARATAGENHGFPDFLGMTWR